MTISAKSKSACLRRTLSCAALTAGILAGSVPFAMAQDACSQMQVYLAIAPNHREDVMAYIATKIKK
jgi:hypothetical protein